MTTKNTYTITETFNILKANKITSNIESVRRWLRQGKIKGTKSSNKAGWQVSHTELQRFLAERLPETITTNVETNINKTNVVEDVQAPVVLTEEDMCNDDLCIATENIRFNGNQIIGMAQDFTADPDNSRKALALFNANESDKYDEFASSLEILYNATKNIK